MNKKKIINDPVYGFITIPYTIIYDLIEHPAFQRLRRIRQTGLSDFVYPGALHTRFHHALGAMHLMKQAIDVLRAKGTEITEEEAEAVCAAILLHDIGHGPFSHALEHTLLDVHHETISLVIMERINVEMNGKITLAIQIFKNEYHKTFLHHLVSSQLDMDRMDYLNRDSFFTGVAEGKIGYDRIIKMLAVKDDQLVVEEKGIYSIEKFLMARRIMYWQVYLHKAVLSAEHMLIQTLKRARFLTEQGQDLPVSSQLKFFLKRHVTENSTLQTDWLNCYFELDDVDILMALKQFVHYPDRILQSLAKGIIFRKLFRVELQNDPFSEEYLGQIKSRLVQQFQFDEEDFEYLFKNDIERNHTYDVNYDEIQILFKNGNVVPISKLLDINVRPGVVEKHFLFYPKLNQTL